MKKQTSDKPKKKTRRKKSIGKKILKGFSIFLLSILFIGAIVFAFNYKSMKEFYDNSIAKIDAVSYQTFLSKMPTVIYDKDGQVIRELAQYEYEYLNYKDIQPSIVNAFISIEDPRFWDHHGVDVKALFRAGFEFIKNKGEITQGGSTITQQLVKNTILSHEQTFKRKFQEIIIARKLEDKYSKEQILEFYINNIYFGNGNYGIESASNYYFGKASKELSLSEICFLASIPNNPTMFDPINNIENTLERRNLILEKMLSENTISQNEYNKAKSEKITLNVQQHENYEQEGYMLTYAIHCTIEELMAKSGFKFRTSFKDDNDRTNYFNSYDKLYQEISASVRKGGYKIYTSLDPKKQELLQSSLDNNLSGYYGINPDTGLYTMQGAAVTIDNSTGNVVAIVGGRNQEGVDNTFNRAYLAARQPGSTIKPLVAYTPAFERGYNANSIVEDKAIPKGPSNYYNYYKGPVTIRYATEISINTIPFNLVNEMGVDTALSYLHNMNFEYIMPSDTTPIVSLGGFTKGTTPVEMAGAYSTLARNGKYIKSTCLEKIENYENEVLYKNPHTEVEVYTEDAAKEMTSVLEGVINKPHATGYGAALTNGMPAAAKTGTTDSDKDSWFCGYTPYYTTAVYVGADIPETIYNAVSVSKNIWKDYMNEINSGLPLKSFDGNTLSGPDLNIIPEDEKTKETPDKDKDKDKTPDKDKDKEKDKDKDKETNPSTPPDNNNENNTSGNDNTNKPTNPDDNIVNPDNGDNGGEDKPVEPENPDPPTPPVDPPVNPEQPVNPEPPVNPPTNPSE